MKLCAVDPAVHSAGPPSRRSLDLRSPALTSSRKRSLSCESPLPTLTSGIYRQLNAHSTVLESKPASQERKLDPRFLLGCVHGRY